jgi:hypothetical protein
VGDGFHRHEFYIYKKNKTKAATDIIKVEVVNKRLLNTS